MPIGGECGYSRLHLNLGRFERRDENNTYLGTFDAGETSHSFSFCLCVGYYLRLGFGLTTKRIESKLAPFGTTQDQGVGIAKVSAQDWGMIAQLPMIRLAEAFAANPILLAPKLAPLCDLTFGLARANIGGDVNYGVAAFADPLPRKARMGASIE